LPLRRGLFKKKQPEPVEDTPDYATLYLADPSLVGSEVLKKAKGLQSYEGLSDEEGAATGLRLRFQAGEIRMNFMPGPMIEEHLAGLSGFVEQAVPDRENLPYVLSRIQNVKMVIGCVITPGFDEAGVMFEAVMNLNCELNGLLMLGDSLFDRDATPLAGSACAGG
jgi:hypothetical protein